MVLGGLVRAWMGGRGGRGIGWRDRGPERAGRGRFGVRREVYESGRGRDIFGWLESNFGKGRGD